MSDAIRDAIMGATEYLRENPEEARSTDSEAVATLDGGLRVTVTDPSGRTLTTDMTKGIGGEDTAPSPGWLFRAAVAACDTTLIAMRAAVSGIELSDLEVRIDSVSDDQGILGLDENVPPGPLSVRTRVRISAAGVDELRLRELVEDAVAHCPVCDATKRAVPMTLEVDVV